MNRIIKNLCLTSLFVLSVISTFSTVNANPSLIISDYTLEPTILSPGDTALLSVTISNMETTSTKTETDYINSLAVDQTTETIGAIIESIYISSDGDGTYNVKAHEDYEDIAEIAPGSSFTVDFTITADKQISDGVYTPIIHVDLTSDNYQDVSFPLTVKISNQSIEMIEEDLPDFISTNGGTDAVFKIINNRKNEISSIYISPQIDNDIIIKPSSQYISSIDSESSELVTFSLIPKNEGMKDLTFQCIYKNGDNQHNETFHFKTNAENITEVYPIIYHFPSSIKKGETDEIRLKIYNAKNEEITGVIIKPTADGFLSPNEYFIGSMDANELYAVTFDVVTDDLIENQSYDIDFTISYKQDNNYYTTTPYSSSFTIEKSEQTNGTEIIIGSVLGLILIIFICVFFFYKRKKR